MRKLSVNHISIEIIRGVPVPPRNACDSWAILFEKMEKGDSFRLETATLVRSALMAARRLGVKVTSRKMEKGGWMVWKLEHSERR